jgi:ATP phosphoribosyltransferase regulatory subunit
VNALSRYLSLSAPAGTSVGAIAAFARETGVQLGGSLERFAQRLDFLATARPPCWQAAVFSAEAGRRFEYYDGFVFELARDGSFERPVLSGGRYDRLITRLSGGARKASAIGAALRADRLAGVAG